MSVKTLSILFSVVFSVALGGVIVIGGYWGVKFVVDLFRVLEPQAAVLTTIASVTALLCAAMISRGFAMIGQKEVNVHTRVEKAHLYERVLLIWSTKLKSRSASIDPAAENELQQLVQLLTLRGSPKVIQAYVELHTLEKTDGLFSPDLPSRLVTLQLEMRKDLGLSSQNLKAEDLLQLLFDHENAVPEPVVTQQRHDVQPRVSLAAHA